MPFACTICYERLTDSDAGPNCTIACGHCFHNACLLRWLESSSNRTCPQCRQSTSTTDIRQLILTESPENALEQNLKKLSHDVQAENVALRTLTQSILQLRKQVIFVQERALALEDSNQKNGEMIGKIYALETQNKTRRNWKNIFRKPSSTLLYSTLGIICVVLVGLLRFWTFNKPTVEFTKPKNVPHKPVAINFNSLKQGNRHCTLIFEKRKAEVKADGFDFLQPFGLKLSVAQLISKIPAEPLNMLKSSISTVADTVKTVFDSLEIDQVINLLLSSSLVAIFLDNWRRN